MDFYTNEDWLAYNYARGIFPRASNRQYPKRSKIQCQTQKKAIKSKIKQSKKIKKFQNLAQEFFLHFSAPGVTRIYSSNSLYRRVAWSILVLGILFSMTYMTYKVIYEYLEYKKIVERSNLILSKMEFPAVTICSPVTLPKSRIKSAGVEHLIRLEKFLESIQKNGQSKENRRVCDLNPACIWSWFEDECECLSNPCESEYCEPGYPSCRCSSLLCDEVFSKQFSKSCFLQNSTNEYDDACICQNKYLEFNRSYLYRGISSKDDSFLSEIKNEKLQDLLYYIKNSHIDDLSDVQWAFQPNIYDISNYGTSFDNLIIGCSFLKERCDKRNFTIFYTSTHGKCYSFNYAGELSKQHTPLETKKYGWNSGLQLYLQIREDEVINLLSKEIGVVVVVHDSRELPYVSEYGLIVRSGDSASLRVQNTQINRLGSPWGNCLDSGSHLPFNYKDIPYSQLGCQRYCQNFYIYEKCKCVKRTLLPSVVKRPKVRNKKICNFTDPSQRKCADEVIELIENETIPCNCHQACKENIFQTSLTAGHINKNFFRLVKAVKTLRIKNDSFIASFTSTKSNILGLKVYYGTLSLQNTTERQAYSWETLIANIGGNLGFFMGLTLITFLEVAELLWDLLTFNVKSK